MRFYEGLGMNTHTKFRSYSKYSDRKVTANSVDQDLTAPLEPSDQDLHFHNLLGWMALSKSIMKKTIYTSHKYLQSLQYSQMHTLICNALQSNSSFYWLTKKTKFWFLRFVKRKTTNTRWLMGKSCCFFLYLHFVLVLLNG